MRCVVVLLFLVVLGSPLAADDDPLFSGPQPGEKLGPLPVRQATVGDDAVRVAAEPVDWIEQAGDKPLLLIFVHKLTRPAFGLARALADYVEDVEGASTAIVFLAEDPTDVEQWMNRARGVLPRNARLGIAADGADGPGAYGLNRNVTLTVIVGNDGKAAANFALVQPSLQADALKIAKQLAKAAGAEPPTAEQLVGGREQMRVDIRPLLAPVIRKDASEQEVEEAAAKVEERAARDPAFKRAVGEAASRVVGSGRLEGYGTPAAQARLKKWAAWAPPQRGEGKRPDAKRPDPRRGDAKGRPDPRPVEPRAESKSADRGG